MNSITYDPGAPYALAGRLRVRVHLEGKYVGHIEQLSDGMWQYWPKGPKSEGGEKFPTLAACKQSLEEV